jgi:hypothetical protein
MEIKKSRKSSLPTLFVEFTSISKSVKMSGLFCDLNNGNALTYTWNANIT